MASSRTFHTGRYVHPSFDELEALIPLHDVADVLTWTVNANRRAIAQLIWNLSEQLHYCGSVSGFWVDTFQMLTEIAAAGPRYTASDLPSRDPENDLVVLRRLIDLVRAEQGFWAGDSDDLTMVMNRKDDGHYDDADPEDLEQRVQVQWCSLDRMRELTGANFPS